MLGRVHALLTPLLQVLIINCSPSEAADVTWWGEAEVRERGGKLTRDCLGTASELLSFLLRLQCFPLLPPFACFPLTTTLTPAA